MLILKKLMNNPMCAKKLFIVGIGRSGTTLLQSMLNAHPDICFTPETHFIKRFIVPQLSSRKELSKKDLQGLLQKDKYFSRLNIPIEENLKKYRSVISNQDLIELFDCVLNQYAKSKNKSFVGDKDPMNSSYISQIQYCFPKSFLIHIIRDPRDVILSRMKSDWGKDTSFAVHLAEHNVQLENMLSNGMALFREKYVEVYYEQLLENPAKELQKICNKIGLLYNREMLDFQKKAEELVFSEEKAWKGNVSKPILKNNKNKWKSGLTNYQVSLVELVLKKHFILLGYPMENKVLFSAFLMKFYVGLIALLFRVKLKKQLVR